MDLVFLDAEPSDAERASVDDLLGPARSTWKGGEVRTADDLRLVRGGRAMREQRHLLLPALARLQADVGWISPGGLNYVCQRLWVPPAEAYGVASFYALLSTEERPGTVIHVCDDIGCRSFGANELIAGLEVEIGKEGEVRQDRMWVTSPCLGQCDRAPAAFLQNAGRSDAVVTTAGPATVLAASGAHPLPSADTGAPQTAGDRAGLRVLARVGAVDPVSLDDYRSHGGYSELERILAGSPADVVDEVKASNLRGRGGAAFPTGVKWEGVAGQPDGPRYLVCNADESEPGTFKDRVLMEHDPFALIEAMTYAAFAVGASQAYIYIRGEYPVATARLGSAIEQAAGSELLGRDILGSGFDLSIELRRGQGAYICGEETALFNSIEGFRGEPRQKPPFPTTHGLFGRPTVINNVETLVNVLDIVADGGAAFAGLGTDQSTGTRLFCLSGHVATPGVYEHEFGATVRDVIAAAGGSVGEVQAVLLGGAAGSFITEEYFDVPLTFEDARSAGISLGSGVVMVFNDSVDLTDTGRRIAQFFRDESCGQCVPCRVGTVRVEEALARHLANGHEKVDAALIAEIDLAMKDASICGLGHTAATAVRSLLDQGLIGSRDG